MRPDNKERDADIWRMACAGYSGTRIAEKHGLTQGRISQIIDRERGKIPRLEKEDLRQMLTEQLNDLRARADVIAHMDPAPVTVGSEGCIIMDPRTHEPVWDYSGVLAAMKTVAQLQERLARMLGLDQPMELHTQGELSVKYEIVSVPEEDMP